MFACTLGLPTAHKHTHTTIDRLCMHNLPLFWLSHSHMHPVGPSTWKMNGIASEHVVAVKMLRALCCLIFCWFQLLDKRKPPWTDDGRTQRLQSSHVILLDSGARGPAGCCSSQIYNELRKRRDCCTCYKVSFSFCLIVINSYFYCQHYPIFLMFISSTHIPHTTTHTHIINVGMDNARNGLSRWFGGCFWLSCQLRFGGRWRWQPYSHLFISFYFYSVDDLNCMCVW